MNLKTVFLTAALAVSSLGLARSSDFLLTVTPALTAAEYARQSAIYLTQARLEYTVAYAVAYADLPLYNRAIANAEAAVRSEPNNPSYVQSAAMLYAKTQWRLPAHQHLASLRDLVTLLRHGRPDRPQTWLHNHAARRPPASQNLLRAVARVPRQPKRPPDARQARKHAVSSHR